MDDKNLNICVYNVFNDEIKNIWDDLLISSEHYLFQNFDWVFNWYNKIGVYNYEHPVILLIKYKYNPVAIFPFALKRKYSVKILEFIGGDQSDYNVPIVNDKINLNEFGVLWKFVLNNLPKHDLLNLRKMPDHINLIGNKLLHYIKCDYHESAYNKTLSDDLSLTIPKKLRNDSKRQIKRLNKLGRVEFVVATKKDEYDSIVNDMILQKEKRYLMTGSRNILSDKNVRNYYKDIAIENEKLYHLSALKIDNNIIAAHWGCIYQNRFYFLHPSYDQNYYQYSPGRLLVEYLLNIAVESKLEIFDFTIGSEGYKKKYCDNELKIFNYITYRTLKGFVYSNLLKYIYFLKSNKLSRALILFFVKKYRTIFYEA